VASGDPIQEIGINPDFENAIGGLAPGGVTPLIAATGNKLAVAMVTDVHPARQAELAEVEHQIRERLLTEKAQRLAQERAREAADKAKAGADLRQVARSMGMDLKQTPEFDRSNTALEAFSSASYVEEAFGKEIGAIIGPVSPGTGDVLVARLAAKTPAEMSKLDAEREQILVNLKARKARERKDLLEDSIVSELVRQGKVKINQTAIQRLQSVYRS
jgi:hypothetical protein